MNMSVAIESLNEIERKMTVTIPADELDKAFQQRLVELSSKIRLDGFRKGKVPVQVVKQRYGQAAFAEAVEKCVRDYYIKSLEQEKIAPVGMPEIDPGQFEIGQPVTFTATFEVFPEIALKDFASLSVEKPNTEISDADVEQTIQNLREQRAELSESTDPIANGDKVDVSYEAFVDGEKQESESKDKMELTIGSDVLIDGFEAGLIGKKAGEQVELGLIFSKDYVNESLQDKPVTYKVTINTVSKKILPEINQEFISALGVEGDIDALKAEIKKNMAKDTKYRLKNAVKSAVLEALAAAHEFKIPKDIIKQEAERLRQQGANYFKNMYKDMKLPELPLEMFMAEAEKNAKFGLLVSEIVKQQKLEVQQELVDERIADLATMYDQVDEAKRWLSSDKKQLENIKAQVLEDQVINSVLELAQVTEKQLSYEELSKLK